MPNWEQGEKERTGETDGEANRRGHAEREGKRGGWGGEKTYKTQRNIFETGSPQRHRSTVEKVESSWRLAPPAFSL